MKQSQLENDVAVLNVRLQNSEDKCLRTQKIAQEEIDSWQKKVESARAETEQVRAELDELKLRKVMDRSRKDGSGEDIRTVREERDRAIREKRVEEERSLELQRQVNTLQIQLEEVQHQSEFVSQKGRMSSINDYGDDVLSLKETIRKQKEMIDRLTNSNQEKDAIIRDMVAYIEERVTVWSVCSTRNGIYRNLFDYLIGIIWDFIDCNN